MTPKPPLTPNAGRRLWVAAALATPWLAAARSPAVLVEGHRYPSEVQVAGARLALNGTGVRAVAWFKGFSAALYTGSPAATAAQVLALPGPKRLEMVMLHDVPAGEFVKAFHKGMARNSPRERVDRLLPRMARFEAMIAGLGKVRKGDVVDLDFDPGAGTLFVHNGRRIGDVIAGDDFYDALLLSFVGERPYDDRLKAGLLGVAGG